MSCHAALTLGKMDLRRLQIAGSIDSHSDDDANPQTKQVSREEDPDTVRGRETRDTAKWAADIFE